MSEPTIFGADGRVVTNQVAYPLGSNVLGLSGTPEQLFRAGFQAVDANGNFHVPAALIALWASASAAYVERAQHGHVLECRIAAMERTLMKHHPEIHKEYIEEVKVVAQEAQERAKAMHSPVEERS